MSTSFTRWPKIEFTTEESRILWETIYDEGNYPSMDLNNLRRYWRAASLVVPHKIIDIGAGEEVLGNILKQSVNVGCPQIEYCGADFAYGYNNFDLNARLPFQAETFTTGYALDILEHLTDPEFTIRELARITKYRIVVSIPQYNKNPDANHIWNFTLDDLFKLMTTCGKTQGAEEIAGIGWIIWADKNRWDNQAISKNLLPLQKHFAL